MKNVIIASAIVLGVIGQPAMASECPVLNLGKSAVSKVVGVTKGVLSTGRKLVGTTLKGVKGLVGGTLDTTKDLLDTTVDGVEGIVGS